MKAIRSHNSAIVCSHVLVYAAEDTVAVRNERDYVDSERQLDNSSSGGEAGTLHCTTAPHKTMLSVTSECYYYYYYY